MSEVDGTIVEVEEAAPPGSAETPEDPFRDSPLSEATRALGRHAIRWTGKQTEIATRRRRTLIALGELQRQDLHALADDLAASGSADPATALTEAAEKRRAEMRRLEETLRALEAGEKNLPLLAADFTRRYQAARDKERAQGHEQLAKELRNILKSAVYSPLRTALKAIEANMPRIRALHAEAHRWAEQSEDGRNFSGATFIVPLNLAAPLLVLRWVIGVLGHEIGGQR